jgi:hypothetical protein
MSKDYDLCFVRNFFSRAEFRMIKKWYQVKYWGKNDVNKNMPLICAIINAIWY